MNKIIIIVDGGNVQEVLSNNQDIEVELVDYDHKPASYLEREEDFMVHIKECPYALNF